MKRGSKTLEYERILEDFYHFFPAANYGADIIVGFPEETEKEHLETLDFVSQSRLNYVHIFPFSPRPGTKAELMEQLPVNVVRRRVKELKEINRHKRVSYRERFLDQIVPGILIEENESYSLAITNNFLSVRIPPLKGYKKRKIWIRIDRVLNENLCAGAIARPKPRPQATAARQ